MNTIILMGNLTKDIETRYTQSQKAVANTSIAVKRDFKNGDGEYDTDFINCIAFDKTAELMAKYLQKGSKVCLEGRWQTGSYEKDGKKIYTNDMVVNQVHFVDSKKVEDNVEKEVSPYDIPKEKEDPYRSFGSNIHLEEETSDLPF